LEKIVPDAKIEHRWSGQVIETNDGLPFIGENAERQFIATGFCGNGITFGTISAMMARDWATGVKNPWSELFCRRSKDVARGYLGLFAGEQGLSLLPDQRALGAGGSGFSSGIGAGRRDDREVEQRQGRRLSRFSWQGPQAFRNLSSHGMYCALERGGENLGLSLSRLAL
jgi:glycine/D-amino acid oxidase-like deaminating enzyme